VLVVRLDSMGDVLATGPAVRAVAAGASRVTMLASPLGADAARLLPGVDEVLVWPCPWILNPAPAVERADITSILQTLRKLNLDEAVILTSFHQSSLPTALLLRLAGVPRIVASSEDYPGSLLDLRLPPAPEGPEPLRMLHVVRSAGFSLPAGDDARLAVRPVADTSATLGVSPDTPYIAVHPGTTAAARAYPAERWRAAVSRLHDAGWAVVVTGSRAEQSLTAHIAAGAGNRGTQVLDLGGRLTLTELAGVLRSAKVLVAANTGPAHLAAAVGTPVVSLFAPVVPAVRWAPYGIPLVLLGDQDAPCRDTRSVLCPVEGHPCLNSVTAEQIVDSVEQLTSSAAGKLVPR
jgi:ADP-heptose:LPS heptosyltransferase